MTLSFTHEPLPGRVVFGAGSLDRLPAEAARLGARKVLVLSTPGQRALAEKAAALLGDAAVGIHDKAVMHVPLETADAARARVREVGADACVATGGGSTIGLAKAIALDSALPVIAIPTTYAGSEMTPIWGLTDKGVKKTGRDIGVLPRTVIYDPLLTLALPPSVSGTSGINSIAHCVEALYSETANPVTSLMAEEGIRALASLKDIGMKEEDIDRIADLALENRYYNPRPVTRANIRDLLADAYHGRRP